MDDKQTVWVRPFTTRKYLHGPMAEKMYTVWADAKIMCGEIVQGINASSYQSLISAAVWLLHGPFAKKFDYKKVRYVTSNDGIPIHMAIYECGDIKLILECFCSVEKKPVCFVKLTVINTVPWAVNEKLWLMTRTARESLLTDGYGPDGYKHYTPDELAWGRLHCGYTLKGNLLSDGRYSLYIQSPHLPFEWQESWPDGFRYQNRLLKIDIALDPEEEKEFYFSFGNHAVCPFDYQEEKKKAYDFWVSELSKIKLFPESLRQNESGRAMYLSLVAQILQCFCCPQNSGNVLARQGGLQRLIWPVESMPVLEALDRIGDFKQYVDPIIDLYFDALQAKDGENKGEVINLGENWASVTAAAIYSFAKHAHYHGNGTFNKHKDDAYAAFMWIERTRNTTKNHPTLANGLFPPMRSCDWSEKFQAWVTTDVYNLISYSALIDVYEQFNDHRVNAIKVAYTDYLACMRYWYNKILENSKGKDMIRIPLTPDGDDDEFISNYPDHHESRFVLAGIPYNHEEVDRIERYMRHSRPCKNGLTGYFGVITNERYEKHTWYTSISDYEWFYVWLAQGERIKASETLKAQLKYSMTKEYYMIERYTDNDAYFVPWSPNASANGRTILMLCDFFRGSGDTL